MAFTSPYTPEERERLILAVAKRMKEHRESLRAACEAEDVPESTVRRWCDENAEDAAHIARAREFLISKSVQRLEDIAANVELDAVAIQKARLEIDYGKWHLGKLMPKRFGERVRNEIAGDPDAPVQSEITVKFVG